MKSGGSTPYTEQGVRRQESLTTPVTFSATIGGSSTTVYGIPANREEYFLLRKIVTVNSTGSPITLEIQTGGVVWVPSISIPALTSIEEPGLAGMLLEVGDEMTATGAGLTVFGWGVRIQGGDNWTL